MAGSWIFYTTFPKIPLINPEFKNIAQFAPPLGFFIGTIQSYIFLFLRTNSWSIYASALICLASGYLITGGLHIDGLMDTFDGIFAGKKKRLKAMKDSKVGFLWRSSFSFYNFNSNCLHTENSKPNNFCFTYMLILGKIFKFIFYRKV